MAPPRPRLHFRPPLHAPLRTGWQGSRTKLRPRDAATFERAEPRLFGELAHAVCSTAVLPRKELFEAWEVACRVDEHFPSATRVADLAAGHGLLAWILLLIAATDGRQRSAVCVDVRMPASADTLGAAITQRWPELHSSMQYVEGGIEHVRASSSVLVTSVHACGPLTDAVLERAVAGGSPVAVMPCCHSLRKQPVPPVPGLTAEMLAERATTMGAVRVIDEARIDALRVASYEVTTRQIDPEVTPYNRLILARPTAAVEAMEAEPAHGDLEAAPCSGRTRRGLRLIPLADAGAIEKIAGRRPFESARAIEVSLWLAEDHVLNEAALAVLAHRASTAVWRPREEPSLDEQAQTESPCYWDVAAAVKEARQAAVVATPQAEQREAESVSGAGVSVTVTLRETYHDKTSRRRSCAFAIEFVSHDHELMRGEVGMWQARVREALEWWTEDDMASPGEGPKPEMELR